MQYFISAPFGNYIKRPSQALNVTGTWTFNPRSGLSYQILRTLRYVKTDGHWGWRNKIGLRNKGISVGLDKTDTKKEILSIAAIENNDWYNLNPMIDPYRNIEINISCPNLNHTQDTSEFRSFSAFAARTRARWCIVKVPPTATHSLIDRIVYSGYSQIHASNTLPSKKGGLSGKVLIPYTLDIIEYIKKKYSHVEIIAGGGVTETSDVDRYLNAGADHISLGSVCFTPWKLREILNYKVL